MPMGRRTECSRCSARSCDGSPSFSVVVRMMACRRSMPAVLKRKYLRSAVFTTQPSGVSCSRSTLHSKQFRDIQRCLFMKLSQKLFTAVPITLRDQPLHAEDLIVHRAI